jgi:hypothetical protein
MKGAIWSSLAGCLVVVCLMGACAAPPEPAAEEPSGEAPMAAEEMAAVEAEPMADPGPEEAAEVEEFVRAWVAEQAGEAGVYDIPARGDHDVAGSLTAFHTVHRKEADTYSVCVDFQDGDNTYDVDFVVARAEDGMDVADHFLHKVNSEAVE